MTEKVLQAETVSAETPESDVSADKAANETAQAKSPTNNIATNATPTDTASKKEIDDVIRRMSAQAADAVPWRDRVGGSLCYLRGKDKVTALLAAYRSISRASFSPNEQVRHRKLVDELDGIASLNLRWLLLDYT